MPLPQLSAVPVAPADPDGMAPSAAEGVEAEMAAGASIAEALSAPADTNAMR